MDHIVDDIAKRKLVTSKIRHIAAHDVLPDLPSLRSAKDRLSIAFITARRHKSLIAVMFVNLDDSKAIDDTQGHAARDQMLKEVANRIRSGVRENDTVARVGRDEFLLVATGLHASADATRIAERVARLVTEPVILDSTRQTCMSSGEMGILRRRVRGECRPQNGWG